jgi:hypothetical protein
VAKKVSSPGSISPIFLFLQKRKVKIFLRERFFLILLDSVLRMFVFLGFILMEKTWKKIVNRNKKLLKS